jgi:hypothetical protein
VIFVIARQDPVLREQQNFILIVSRDDKFETNNEAAAQRLCQHVVVATVERTRT